MKKFNIKESFRKGVKNKRLRHGSYSMGLALIVLAIIVVINMAVNALPSKFREFDLTGQNLTQISSQTTEVLDALTKDVQIYLVAQSGQEDETTKKLLDNYAQASDHIKFEVRDPVKNPAFLNSYQDMDLYNNSVIVECGDRKKALSPDQIYEYQMDYTNYSSTVTGFDGEGQITSAISYVTSENLGKAYTLTGHDEAAMTDSLKSLIQKQNLETEDLNLITADQVPEDADFLLIFSPMADISAEESVKIQNYLTAGGHAFIVAGYTGGTPQPNLDALLAGYGLERVEGVVVEGDPNHYTGSGQAYIVPDKESHEITSGLEKYILMPMAQGLQESQDHRDTVQVSSLLKTSDAAYSKPDPANVTTMEKEDGDIDGPFMIGAAITETVSAGEGNTGMEDTGTEGADTADTDTEGADTDSTDTGNAEDQSASKETRIVCLTSELMFDQGIDSQVIGGNMELVGKAVSWLTNGEEAAVSIPSKSIDNTSLSMTAMGSLLGFLGCIVVIPLAVLVTGLVIWLGRKNR